MKYKLSKRTLKNLSEVDIYINIIIFRMIEITDIDFGVMEDGGYRTVEMQKKIFENGFSKCDGVKKLSYHQSGKAVDLIPFVDGKYTWNNKNAFIRLLLVWKEAEEQVKKEGKVPNDVYFHHGIFWNWKDFDNDGVLEITDRLGWDCAHHERRSKPQII